MTERLTPRALPALTLGVRQAAGFKFTETRYEPDLRLPWHLHEEACLYVMVEGSFEEIHGLLRPKSRWGDHSTLLFRPAGEPHCVQLGDVGGLCLNIEIARWRVEEMEDARHALSDSAELRGNGIPWLVRRLYDEFRANDADSELAVESTALEALSLLARPSGESGRSGIPGWLPRTEALLRDCFREALTLSELAGQAGVHPVHLATAFRRRYGCSVGEYARQLRVSEACGLLRSPNPSLAEIAVACGFYDQSHFTRVFKQVTGFTPRAYCRHCY